MEKSIPGHPDVDGLDVVDARQRRVDARRLGRRCQDRQQADGDAVTRLSVRHGHSPVSSLTVSTQQADGDAVTRLSVRHGHSPVSSLMVSTQQADGDAGGAGVDIDPERDPRETKVSILFFGLDPQSRSQEKTFWPSVGVRNNLLSTTGRPQFRSLFGLCHSCTLEGSIVKHVSRIRYRS